MWGNISEENKLAIQYRTPKMSHLHTKSERERERERERITQKINT